MFAEYEFDLHQCGFDQEWEGNLYSICLYELQLNPVLHFDTLMAIACSYLKQRAEESPDRITILTRYATRAVCNAMNTSAARRLS